LLGTQERKEKYIWKQARNVTFFRETNYKKLMKKRTRQGYVYLNDDDDSDGRAMLNRKKEHLYTYISGLV